MFFGGHIWALLDSLVRGPPALGPRWGPSLGSLGLSWATLEPSWRSPGPSWGALGRLLGYLRAVLVAPWAVFHAAKAEKLYMQTYTFSIGNGATSLPAKSDCTVYWMVAFSDCRGRQLEDGPGLKETQRCLRRRCAGCSMSSTSMRRTDSLMVCLMICARASELLDLDWFNQPGQPKW